MSTPASANALTSAIQPGALAAAPGPSGRWLRLARGLWLLIAVSVVANLVIGFPAYYDQQQTVCTTDLAECTLNNLTTPGNVQALHQLGLSLEAYAAFSTLLTAGFVLIFLVVGVMIFWRRSNTWLGLFASLVLIIAGCVSNDVPSVAVVSGPLFPLYGFLIYLLTFVLILGLAVFLLTFPTGKFAPRWTWAVVFLWVILYSSFNVPSPYNVQYWPGILFAGELLLTFGGTIGVQIYRYRRVYTPLQRQQTKWLVFGVSVGIVIEVLSIAIGSLVPGLDAPDSPYQLLNSFFNMAFFVTIPLAVGVAILRYRLWDIDTIINKALVYGSLTALLGALYAGLIIGLTSLAGGIIGTTDQPVALVISTLAIAALFQPARKRIQSLIDRRFYRRKYDAEKTLAAFNATLRNEVDLAKVREHLLSVVQETMQPASVSLWLRQPEQRPKEQVQRTGQRGQFPAKMER